MKAIEAFPISEEEARDLDELKKTFPDKSELRAVLEDYFHIYDDNASMEPQKFDMYFADFINDEKVDDENERLNLYHRLGGLMGSITNSRKSIESEYVSEDPDIPMILDEIGDLPKATVEDISKTIERHAGGLTPRYRNIMRHIRNLKEKQSIKSAFKKGDKFENAYGATIVIDDPDANGRIQYVVRAGNSADCKSVDSDEKMQKILDDNGYIKSALDPTEAQTFKETLIRAGYTEEQAQQILDQANQVEETQGEMMTSGCHGKQKKENKKDTKNRSISSARNISIKSIKKK